MEMVQTEAHIPVFDPVRFKKDKKHSRKLKEINHIARETAWDFWGIRGFCLLFPLRNLTLTVTTRFPCQWHIYI